MSRRDRYLLVVAAAVGAVAAFWMLALQPRMKTLNDVKKDLSTAQSSLEESRGLAAQYAQARLDFPKAYTEMARLGKSVPTNTDQASLVYQLNQAARRAGVKFTVLILDSASGEPQAAPAPPPPAADSGGSGGESGSGGSSGTTGGEGATTAGTTPPTGTGGEGEEVLGSVPPEATLTAAAPAGATTGAANLRVMHFTFEFTGSFFRLEDYLSEIKRLTWSRNKDLLVSGRLVTIDSIEFDGSGRHVKMAATTYLLPTGQGLLAGATPVGPAGVAQGGAQAASAPGTPSTPPTATVTAP